MNTYPVILRREPKGGYFVINPSFEGCYSEGNTIEEALINIKEATELCLEEIRESDDASETNLESADISLHLIKA